MSEEVSRKIARIIDPEAFAEMAEIKTVNDCLRRDAEQFALPIIRRRVDRAMTKARAIMDALGLCHG